jgi:hypothetical protein
MSITYQSTPNVTPTGGTYNDGSSVYGSATITLTSGGSNTFDTNDFTPDYDSSRKELTNKFGVPVQAFALPVTPNGNCNLQVPTNTTNLPKPGNTFTADITGAVTWYIDKVSLPFKKDDFLIVPIAYHQKLN